MKQLAIIGAGAAGLLAGIAAVTNGAHAVIFEKMRTPGRKMLITGKGRCNITNSCDISDFIKNIPGNGRFLNSALHRFTNDDIVLLLESNGVKTKTERGGRIFPASDNSSDVVNALVGVFEGAGGEIRYDSKVTGIAVDGGKVTGIKVADCFFRADAVILAAGGASYPATGSNGEGARLAKEAGHTIIPLMPSLVPLESDSPYLEQLQGLSLRNVAATAVADGKRLESLFGEMLFTHFGVSGPIILSMSRKIGSALAEGKSVELFLDLKPALNEEKLFVRVQRDFNLYSRKQLANGLRDLLPHSLIGPVCDMAYLEEKKYINQVSRLERQRLVRTLKAFYVPIVKTRPLAEAIVTAGGVDTKEIDPKTMQSKVVSNLFFAGEVMDIDGFTGGFNLQAAFSTGFVAGKAASEHG